MTTPVSTDQALRALEPYGLSGARLQLLSDVDCIVYRVTASGVEGQSSESTAALKVYPGHKKDPANVEAEVDWLLALSRETELRVPRPLAARDGSFIQSVATGQP